MLLRLLDTHPLDVVTPRAHDARRQTLLNQILQSPIGRVEILRTNARVIRFPWKSRLVRVTGNELEDWSDDEIVELSPIAVTFEAEGREAGDFVPVRLRASITPVGTLLLEALPLEPRVPGECYKVELSVRKDRAD